MDVVVMVVTVSAVMLVGVPVPMFVVFAAAAAAVRHSSRGGDCRLDFRYAVGLLGRAGGPADGNSRRQVGRLVT